MKVNLGASIISKSVSPLLFLSAIICISAIILSKNRRILFQILINQASCYYHYVNQLSNSSNVAISHQITDEIFEWSLQISDWSLTKQSGLGNQLEGQLCTWPEDCDGKRDRIVNQLQLNVQTAKIFKILPPDYSYTLGRHIFIEQSCRVDKCEITYDPNEADALIFQNSDVLIEPDKSRRKDQIWIAYMLESPTHTFDKRFTRSKRGKQEMNWTASYRSDSDIVTPYSKFVPFKEELDTFLALKSNYKNLTQVQEFFSKASDLHKRLIRHKKGKVAWMASNCNAANNRLEYALELSKYIQVDIYGKCGNLICHKWNQTGCTDLINKNYKFYLSFENSNHRQYITEKLYLNAYGHNDLNHLLVPIVMGAPKLDYEQLAPPASYINVDDFKSPKELASYLKLLDVDDAAYYSYFRWKTIGRFIDTKFMCRVCAMLHKSHSSGKLKSYSNIQDWWNEDTNENRN